MFDLKWPPAEGGFIWLNFYDMFLCLLLGEGWEDSGGGGGGSGGGWGVYRLCFHYTVNTTSRAIWICVCRQCSTLVKDREIEQWKPSDRAESTEHEIYWFYKNFMSIRKPFK